MYGVCKVYTLGWSSSTVGLSSNQDAIPFFPAASRKKKLELKMNKRPAPTLQGDQEKSMELKQRDQSHLFICWEFRKKTPTSWSRLSQAFKLRTYKDAGGSNPCAPTHLPSLFPGKLFFFPPKIPSLENVRAFLVHTLLIPIAVHRITLAFGCHHHHSFACC